MVLGYLNPLALAGGTVPLDAGAARRAVEALGAGQGMAMEEAALGAYQVAVASMVRAVRAVSAERGHDPAGMTLVAFGGNGPLHGVAVAAALGIPRVLVPPAPGVFSAWGLLAASIAHHASRTHLRLLRGIEEGPPLQRSPGACAPKPWPVWPRPSGRTWPGRPTCATPGSPLS